MKLSFVQLCLLQEKLKKEGKTNEELYLEVSEEINNIKSKFLNETSATGGPAVSGGMGAVVSANPSGLAGATIGTNWSSAGGTVGSGDISAGVGTYQKAPGTVLAPYNPSGSNRNFQDVEMGKEHGPRTGKKSRKKRISMKSLKDIFTKRADFMAGQEKRETGKKVMNFQDFEKDDINKVKK